MKKENRVKSHQDFQKVIANKKSFANSSFVMYYATSEYDHPRFGISSSKKLGKAITRNLIRRQVRSMIDEIQKSLSIKAYDIVLIVRKTFIESDYLTNRTNLEKLLIKIKEDNR